MQALRRLGFFVKVILTFIVRSPIVAVRGPRLLTTLGLVDFGFAAPLPTPRPAPRKASNTALAAAFGATRATEQVCRLCFLALATWDPLLESSSAAFLIDLPAEVVAEKLAGVQFDGG